VALREGGMDALRAAVGRLDRLEELIFEPTGRVLVEVLVRLAQKRQRDRDLIRRRGEGVEHLLSRLGG
jgi:hypothetical protein